MSSRPGSTERIAFLSTSDPSPGPFGSRERVEELEILLRAGDLLDPKLDASSLIDLALEISLAAVRADVALIALRADRGGDVIHARRRGDDASIELSETRSRLMREAMRTGECGVQRDRKTPGALVVADLLDGPAAVRIATPLRRLDEVFGVLEVAYRHDPGDRLRDEERALRSVADHLAASLDVRRSVREERRRSEELRLLVEIGGKISAHSDLDDLLDAIVSAIEQLLPSDAVGIFLLERSTGQIHKQTVRGYEPDQVENLHLKIGQGILGWVANEGKGVVVHDVRVDDRYAPGRVETRSEMAAPLTYEGDVIGVFNLESDRVGAFDDHDLRLLQSFCNQAAISITHARLHAEASEKRRLEEQLDVARKIQESLLPRSSPEIPGHVLVGRNIPSSAVGGDYFDFVRLNERQWAVLVADVSGNGIPAGLIMAGFRAEIRAELRRESDPRAVFSLVNEILVQELDLHHFVTAFLGVYTPESGTLVYSSAGHEPGLLVRAGGEVEQLSEGGLLLGVFSGASYGRAMVNLAPGDELLLYTDGLSDAGDPWGDRLGIEGVLRLRREVREAGTPIHDVPEVLLARALEEAPGRSEEADDRTLVVLSRSEA